MTTDFTMLGAGWGFPMNSRSGSLGTSYRRERI
jgi:hypothetical protein